MLGGEGIWYRGVAGNPWKSLALRGIFISKQLHIKCLEKSSQYSSVLFIKESLYFPPKEIDKNFLMLIREMIRENVIHFLEPKEMLWI